MGLFFCSDKNPRCVTNDVDRTIFSSSQARRSRPTRRKLLRLLRGAMSRGKRGSLPDPDAGVGWLPGALWARPGRTPCPGRGGESESSGSVAAPGAGSLGVGGGRSRGGGAAAAAGGAARAGPAGGTRPLGGGRRQPNADKSGSRPAVGWGRDRAAAPPLPGESSGKRPGVGTGFRRSPGPGWAGLGWASRAERRAGGGGARRLLRPPRQERRGVGLGRRPSPLTCSSVKRISLSAALDAITPGFEVRTWALLLPLPPPPAGRGATEAGPGTGLRAHRGRGERSVLRRAGGRARGGAPLTPLLSWGSRWAVGRGAARSPRCGTERRAPRGADRRVRSGAEGRGAFPAVRCPRCAPRPGAALGPGSARAAAAAAPAAAADVAPFGSHPVAKASLLCGSRST